jgi:hypothetical protein
MASDRANQPTRALQHPISSLQVIASTKYNHRLRVNLDLQEKVLDKVMMARCRHGYNNKLRVNRDPQGRALLNNMTMDQSIGCSPNHQPSLRCSPQHPHSLHSSRPPDRPPSLRIERSPRTCPHSCHHLKRALRLTSVARMRAEAQADDLGGQQCADPTHQMYWRTRTTMNW